MAEIPPPGGGFETLTRWICAEASIAEGKVASTVEADMKLEGSGVPSTPTVELWMNPVPLIATTVSSAPAAADEGESPEMVGTGLGAGAVTVMVAAPNLLMSSVDTAVIVTVPELFGAVKSPEEFTVPALALQVTAGLKAPVPTTVALHCDVWPVWTDVGEHVTLTEEIVGFGEGLLPPPPQAVSRIADKDTQIIVVCRLRIIGHLAVQVITSMVKTRVRRNWFLCKTFRNISAVQSELFASGEIGPKPSSRSARA